MERAGRKGGKIVGKENGLIGTRSHVRNLGDCLEPTKTYTNLVKSTQFA